MQVVQVDQSPQTPGPALHDPVSVQTPLSKRYPELHRQTDKTVSVVVQGAAMTPFLGIFGGEKYLKVRHA